VSACPPPFCALPGDPSAASQLPGLRCSSVQALYPCALPRPTPTQVLCAARDPAAGAADCHGGHHLDSHGLLHGAPLGLSFSVVRATRRQFLLGDAVHAVAAVLSRQAGGATSNLCCMERCGLVAVSGCASLA
jgi:hypothetical protein